MKILVVSSKGGRGCCSVLKCFACIVMYIRKCLSVKLCSLLNLLNLIHLILMDLILVEI